MRRWEIALTATAILIGAAIAVLVNYMGLAVYHVGRTLTYLSDGVTFVVVSGVPIIYMMNRHYRLAACLAESEGEWVILKLTDEGFNALHAIMATEGDLSEMAAVNRLLIAQQDHLGELSPDE